MLDTPISSLQRSAESAVAQCQLTAPPTQLTRTTTPTQLTKSAALSVQRRHIRQSRPFAPPLPPPPSLASLGLGPAPPSLGPASFSELLACSSALNFATICIQIQNHTEGRINKLPQAFNNGYKYSVAFNHLVRVLSNAKTRQTAVISQLGLHPYPIVLDLPGSGRIGSDRWFLDNWPASIDVAAVAATAAW